MQDPKVKLVQLKVKEDVIIFKNECCFNSEQNLLEDLEIVRSRYDIFEMIGKGDCKVIEHKGSCVCRGVGRKRSRQRSWEPSRIG